MKIYILLKTFEKAQNWWCLPILENKFVFVFPGKIEKEH